MTTYSPVQYEFKEIIENAVSSEKAGKIFFFSESDVFDSTEGKIVSVEKLNGQGEFIIMSNGAKVRLDRIITVFGKPGPAFDEYDSYGNQCLDCKGGYDL